MPWTSFECTLFVTGVHRADFMCGYVGKNLGYTYLKREACSFKKLLAAAEAVKASGHLDLRQTRTLAVSIENLAVHTNPPL